MPPLSTENNFITVCAHRICWECLKENEQQAGYNVCPVCVEPLVIDLTVDEEEVINPQEG